MSDHLIAEHTPFTVDQWAKRWRAEADARNALFLQNKQLERELAATKSQLARICQEGFGNDDTIGLEPADDYVLRKLAELRAGQAKWQALAEGLKLALQSIYLDDIFDVTMREIAQAALAAYEAAKAGGAARKAASPLDEPPGPA
jgi:hypothetical protein